MNKLTLLLTLSLSASLFTGCEDDIEEIKTSGGTPPVLVSTPSDQSTFTLTESTAADTLLRFQWTDPGYVDASSGSVIGQYLLEASNTTDFASKSVVNTSNEKSHAYTGAALNTLATQLAIEPAATGTIYFRVRSVFFTTDTLVSNRLEYTVTPFSTVDPPAIAVPAELYITGNALPAGWVQPFTEDQKFTQTSETTFQITVDLLGGQSYEMITDGNGVNWTPCYRIAPGIDPATVATGGNFVWDGDGSEFNWTSSLFMSPPEDGSYQISIDFQTATFSVVNVGGPPAITVPERVFITGLAIPAGWAIPFPANQEFTQESATVFSATLELWGNSDYEMVTDPDGVNWTPCYRLAPGTDPTAVAWGGSFVWDGDGSEYNWGSTLFKTPPDNGVYKITLNFQTATYTVEIQ